MSRPGSVARPLAALLGLALLPGTPVPAAPAEVHGFVEGAYGVRTAHSALRDERDFTLEETRVQLRISAAGEAGEAFARLDFLHDPLAAGETEESSVELREGTLRFAMLGDHLEVKAGRQTLTWGTGDLLFINDLFPKDWESFFAGRDDPYLKAPSDALRLGIFGLPVDVEIVLTPEFSPDRLPEPGGRFSIPALEPPFAGTREPDRRLGNGEVAVRLSRYVGDVTVALYGYRGFFKAPEGVRDAGDASNLLLVHPKLSVAGASVRGSAGGGILWAEAGWYDSREDRDGDDARIPNSSLRYLAGYERQLRPDWNGSVQVYGERMLDHEAHVAGAGPAARDEYRHLLTLRTEKLLRYQTVGLSLFAFYSPDDEDAYVRPRLHYDPSDALRLVLGANIFGGGAATPFGLFDEDDNLYVRLRHSF